MYYQSILFRFDSSQTLNSESKIKKIYHFNQMQKTSYYADEKGDKQV